MMYPQPRPAFDAVAVAVADRTPPAPLRLRLAPAPGPAACMTCAVRPGALFGSLDTAALAEVHVKVRPLALAAERPVYGRGSAAAFAFTVRSGVVRIERLTERGDRRIVRLAGPGDLIGLEALLGQRYADDAVACVPSELCAIPAGLIQHHCSRVPRMQDDLLQRWQQALDSTAAWTADICTGPARRRLLKLLEVLHGLAGQDGSVWLPRREIIGAMLDLALETASRLVSQLRAEGVLEVLPGQAARVDQAALARALAAANR